MGGVEVVGGAQVVVGLSGGGVKRRSSACGRISSMERPQCKALPACGMEHVAGMRNGLWLQSLNRAFFKKMERIQGAAARERA